MISRGEGATQAIGAGGCPADMADNMAAPRAGYRMRP